MIKIHREKNRDPETAKARKWWGVGAEMKAEMAELCRQ